MKLRYVTVERFAELHRKTPQAVTYMVKHDRIPGCRWANVPDGKGGTKSIIAIPENAEWPQRKTYEHRADITEFITDEEVNFNKPRR
jgi:ferritin-like protein